MTSSHTSKKQEKKQDPDLPPTAWAVLGLLSFPGERTGYELKKWADSSLRFFYWSPAISQIYAELRRLEELGYAASARSGPEEARAKRRYSITGAGREALSGWAADTAEAGPPVLKHGLLLRIWLGHLAEPARLRAMVGEHLERTRTELAAVREAMEQAAGVAEWAFPALALRWSERQHLAELELGEALLADLAELSPQEAAGGRQAGGDSPTPG
ncbi:MULTISPECIES: PadR family transcriptional regulator [Streptomyces]|uniref:Transcription regulator PadR N-terminal domain-containing protein n=1 Tax=Streptomyces virginiae TaxID=1961 RepID=A0ABQ3NLG1_STRVG|nr:MULTISPECIES: PadR family transcriptional regulator [Streptomyces]KOU11866.1 PadR family transcriptional regulator [Streptomyces sp. WM6349]KOU93383.1 PadR family transcriptional regulator [Streptomyces sp. XY593]KOU96535.1 PadR family transcriptional regulator [Streptomyces sp. XY511]KOV52887.1 PadR family transcriptional regulator [Streptomyces sp. H036]MBP2342523.1 DNA-binding PadR family transcriptional regulator [Streptomyces virginiae]